MSRISYLIKVLLVVERHVSRCNPILHVRIRVDYNQVLVILREYGIVWVLLTGVRDYEVYVSIKLHIFV